MCRVEFIVALLWNQLLGLDVDSGVGIDLLFEWFHGDGGKLLQRISQD